MPDEEITIYERDEYAIKDAFRETFNENYIAHMRTDYPGIDEILWMAFAHGWVAKVESEDE